jgi:serine/threonine protein kinase
VTTATKRIRRFDLEEGTELANTYIVEQLLGRGWEGEVYRVRDRHTGIRRALKLFFPQRNPRNVTLRRYAKKLEKLRRCDLVIQYHHTDTIEFDGWEVACLVSELVEGPVLGDYLKSLPGRRMPPFDALHLLYALAIGMEEVHLAREYHGDLHDGNVFIEREGIFFRPKVFDFFHRGPTRRANQQDDVTDLVRILYDATGGANTYRGQPEFIKAICCGQRNDLVRKRYPTVSHLRRYLESFTW